MSDSLPNLSSISEVVVICCFPHHTWCIFTLTQFWKKEKDFKKSLILILLSLTKLTGEGGIRISMQRAIWGIQDLLTHQTHWGRRHQDQHAESNMGHTGPSDSPNSLGKEASGSACRCNMGHTGPSDSPNSLGKEASGSACRCNMGHTGPSDSPNSLGKEASGSACRCNMGHTGPSDSPNSLGKEGSGLEGE